MTSEVRAFQTAAVDPYRRGHELGAGNTEAVHEAYRRYLELWAAYGVRADEVAEIGGAVLGPVEAYSPALRAEIAGIAAGSGLAEWQLGAVNARSELIALGDQRLVAAGRLPGEVLECSTLVRLPRGGDPVSSQTWDWHTPLQHSWFVWTLALPAGRRVRTLTEYGMLGKIGVALQAAAHGTRRGVLAVHFNALRHRADTGLGGVPVHVVARRILDEAATVEDAVAIARAAQVTASAALTVTARSQRHRDWAARTLELHPGGPAVLPPAPAPDGGGCWAAHTNHFVAGEVAHEDVVLSEGSTSRERLDRVARLARCAPGEPADGAEPVPQAWASRLASHDLGPRSVCVHGFPDAPVGQRTATLAVAVAEPAAGRLHVHAGKACQARAHSWSSG